MDWRRTALRVFSLVGLTAAVLLAVDDLRTIPSFCQFDEGCAKVTSSAFGRPLGVPLSLAGATAFGLFFVAALVPSERLSRSLGPAAVAAGLIGMALVAVQVFVLERICRLCLVVDGAAMLLAAVALAVPFRVGAAELGRGSRTAWIAAAAAAIAAGPAWSFARAPSVAPEEIRRTWKADVVNVVLITSFTCPFCRATDEAAAELRRRFGDSVRVVRIVAPSATDAEGLAKARTYQCAVRQGAGDRIAGPLFAVDRYDPAALREVARAVGLDPARYVADLADPMLDRESDQVRDMLDRRSPKGLPQVWVQDIFLFGEQTVDDMAAAVARTAKAGPPASERDLRGR